MSLKCFNSLIIKWIKWDHNNLLNYLVSSCKVQNKNAINVRCVWQKNVTFAQDFDLGLKSPGPTTIPPLTFKVKECSKASQGMENSITESQFASQVSRPDILFSLASGQWPGHFGQIVTYLVRRQCSAGPVLLN